MEKDPINPSHYKDGPFKMKTLECIDVTRHLPFAAGNAVKYLWRAGNKGPALEDLKKAMWYLNECAMNDGAESALQELTKFVGTLTGSVPKISGGYATAKAIFALTESCFGDILAEHRRVIIHEIIDRKFECAISHLQSLITRIEHASEINDV